MGSGTQAALAPAPAMAADVAHTPPAPRPALPERPPVVARLQAGRGNQAVLRMQRAGALPAIGARTAGPVVQRKCACGGGKEECDSCGGGGVMAQRKASGG